MPETTITLLGREYTARRPTEAEGRRAEFALRGRPNVSRAVYLSRTDNTVGNALHGMLVVLQRQEVGEVVLLVGHDGAAVQWLTTEHTQDAIGMLIAEVWADA